MLNSVSEFTADVSREGAVAELHPMLEDEEKQGRIITTLIVILFLLHPTLTTAMFNAFR